MSEVKVEKKKKLKTEVSPNDYFGTYGYTIYPEK